MLNYREIAEMHMKDHSSILCGIKNFRTMYGLDHDFTAVFNRVKSRCEHELGHVYLL